MKLIKDLLNWIFSKEMVKDVFYILLFYFIVLVPMNKRYDKLIVAYETIAKVPKNSINNTVNPGKKNNVINFTGDGTIQDNDSIQPEKKRKSLFGWLKKK